MKSESLGAEYYRLIQGFLGVSIFIVSYFGHYCFRKRGIQRFRSKLKKLEEEIADDFQKRQSEELIPAPRKIKPNVGSNRAALVEWKKTLDAAGEFLRESRGIETRES